MFSNKGQSLIELLVVIALSAVIYPSLVGGFIASRDGRVAQRQRLIATTVLKETQEEVRNVRERSWNEFATDGTFHTEVSPSGTTFILKPAPITVGGFTRQVDISDVRRNTGGAIVTTGGTVDPSTKMVVTTISWTQPLNSSLVETTYLTRFRDNLTITETKKTADFLLGTGQNILVKDTTGSFPDDGEVTLGAGGNLDWCSPGTPVNLTDLSGQGDARGVVADYGRAYIGMGQNASSKPFYNVRVIIPTAPTTPTVTQLGVYDPTPRQKSNDVYGQTIGSNYFGYLATDKEIIILNVNPDTPEKLLSIDLAGGVNGKGVFVEGDMLYATTSDGMLYRYQLSSDRTSAAAKGSISLKINGNQVVGNKIYVINGYVFIALDSSGYQLKIIDGTDPTTLKDIAGGQIQLSDQPAQGVVARSDSNRAYVVTSMSSTKSEFFIIDTTNKGSLSILAQYDTNTNGNMDPKAVTLVTGNKAIFVGYNGDQYIVLQHLDQDKADFCGKINVSGLNINGVSTIVENNRSFSYIITNDSSKEFQMIEGGPGGGATTQGIFISQLHQYSFPTAFNRFVADINQPSYPTTSVQLQIAVAPVNSSTNDCSGVTYAFIGPDPANPTTSSFTTSSPGVTSITGIIPFGNPASGYQNPGSCFKYKAVLSTTDLNQAPTLYDITFNFSP